MNSFTLSDHFHLPINGMNVPHQWSFSSNARNVHPRNFFYFRFTHPTPFSVPQQSHQEVLGNGERRTSLQIGQGHLQGILG